MREMKDSGFEWIGEIPAHWTVRKIKYVATEIYKGNGITREELFEDGDTPCVRYGDIYTKYNHSFESAKTATKLDRIASPKHITYGDILFAGTGELVEEIGKSIVYLGNEDCLAGGDIVIVSHTQDPRFMGYATDSSYMQLQKSYGKAKLKVVHISAGEIGSLLVILPPFLEQSSIADYLDSKCSQIDFIIEKTQQEIEKLKEYRQSMIAEAVTKGLDPDVEMKDSGVEWIGEIPKDWKVVPIKRCYQVTLGKMIQSVQKKPNETLENYLCAANVKLQGLKTDEIKRMWFSPAEKEQLLLKDGDVLVTEGGATAGEPCVYDGSYDPCYFQNSVNRIRPKGKNTPQFIMYWMSYVYEAGLIDAICNKATFTHYTKEKVEETPMVLPSLAEQIKIVDYLDAITEDINKACDDRNTLIDKLQQYKKSLIYECVTGKKEVLSNA